MEEFFAISMMVYLAATSVISGNFLARDYRHFDQVASQCEQSGYIQNKTIRINCSLEGKK